MNCKECQKQILQSLAANECVVPEAAAHRTACAACAALYREQQELFRRVDTGLQSLVNQPVPPSLLPRVRGQLEVIPVSPWAWWPVWSLTVVAAVAILGFTVAHVPGRPHSVANFRQIASIASQRKVPPQSIRGHARTLAHRKALVLPGPNHKSATREVPRTPAPDVIVSIEERRAFASFVAQVSENSALAAGLTQPVPKSDADKGEIASLQIDPMEVKLLEGSAGR